MHNIDLSIIIPCFNEEKTVSKILDKIINLNIKKEIIIIDDFSKDNTQKIISEYESEDIKIIYNDENLGKGACIKKAQSLVKGRYVIIQDADLEYNPEDYYKILDVYKNKNVEVVYGSRLLNVDNSIFNSQFRIIINKILTFMYNFLYKQNITDAHTCYKSFKTEIFKKIKLVENGFNFCAEINCKLAKLNIKIHEIPIEYRGRSYKEGKKITFLDGIETIKTYFKYF